MASETFLASPRIFVSHAAKDRLIVTALVDAFSHGLNVSMSTFFCSSIPEIGIPNGLSFIDYIKSTLEEPKLVIFIVSPHFLASHFCHAESGAAWVKSAQETILIVPSLDVADLTGIFMGKQVGAINSAVALNGVSDIIVEVTGAHRNVNQWERVRDAFLTKIQPLLPIPRQIRPQPRPHPILLLVVVGLVAFFLGMLVARSQKYSASPTTVFALPQTTNPSNTASSTPMTSPHPASSAAPTTAVQPITGALTHYNLGASYLDKRDYQTAIDEYTIAIRLDPAYTRAYYDRALCYYFKKDYDHAISDFGATVGLDPENGEAYRMRGNCYYYKGEYGNAINDFTQKIDRDKRDANTRYWRGLAYYSSQQYTQAISDFTAAMELDSGSVLAYYNRGLAYMAVENYPSAITDFTQAIKLDPDNRSINDFNDNIGRDPKKPSYFDRRGEAYKALGKMAEANSDFERANALRAH